jgi:hypothetical protein
LHRNGFVQAMTAMGQIRLLPQPPRCRSSASGSPPIPDSVASFAGNDLKIIPGQLLMRESKFGKRPTPEDLAALTRITLEIVGFEPTFDRHGST